MCVVINVTSFPSIIAFLLIDGVVTVSIVEQLTINIIPISIIANILIINQPIKASEVSEMDTISYHNYQLEKCILGKNLSYELAGMQSNGQLDESSIR